MTVRYDSVFFSTALFTGRADILSDMYANGFSIDGEELGELIKTAAVFYTEPAAPAIAYLANVQNANTAAAVNKLAAKGDVSSLENLRAAGVDIFRGSSAFFLAFFSRQTPMMDYLYKNGAALYEPGLLKGLYDRKTETGPEAIAVYRGLVEKDRIKNLALFRSKGVVNDYREMTIGADGKDTTFLHLAAKAGLFGGIAAPCFSAADLLKKDACGETVLSILCARGEVDAAFSPKLWSHMPESSLQLADWLRDVQACSAVDIRAVMPALKQHNTAAVSRRGFKK